MDVNEWPTIADTPDDDTLPVSHRPTGQALAEKIWWDGEILAAEQQSVHYYSNALHYGSAVFEGLRVYPTDEGPALFRLRDHIVRFLNSGAIIGLKIPFSEDDLVEAAIAVTRANGIDNGYLRPLAFFGHGPIDLKPKQRCPVHVFIAVRELGTFLGEGALRNGIRVTISSWRKFHHTMLPTMAKASGNYANSVLAAHEALDRGFDDAILLNQEGTVASATGENVFFVKDGQLYTNDESSSIVPGITRDCILHFARELNVPVTVRQFTREELLRADEVFLTGTAAEVTPVREIDGREYPTGRKTFGAAFQRMYLRAVTGKDDKNARWLTVI